jgi:NitT/TauT family transport system substrate-binding protein
MSAALRNARTARFVAIGYLVVNSRFPTTMQQKYLRELPYSRWREANPDDTLRFFALRLHEVGMIKSTPQKLLAQGTDWRYLNELRRELKA